MRFRKGMQVGAVLLALLSGVAAARGIHRPDPRESVTHQIREQPHAQSGVSMDQAIENAQRRYKARVVRAEVSESNGRRVYVLRLLSEEGRVWTIKVDAETGGET